MSKYSKFNIIYRLQKWLDSVPGQTFMNYAYSWGASVVILGTLFKLTHLPGANFMLFLGMGTEVFVFFISAFDRPFDKTAEGRDLPTETALAAQEQGEDGIPEQASQSVQPTINGTGGIVFVGGGAMPAGNVQGTAPSEAGDATGSNGISGNTGVSGIPGTTGVSTQPGIIPTISPEEGAVILGPSTLPPTPAPAVSEETAEEMEEVTKTYIERLKELNEILLKIGAISERLTTDSQEMENLNRTLTGIARVYEMQLKSASQQITTQDEINSETRKMAEEIKELNAVYARMIEAMTVNMPKA